MNLARETFDYLYDVTRPLIFELTEKDPGTAHDWFVGFSQFLHFTGLEKFVLDNKSNQRNSGFKISNAAGLNKNGNIPPTFLKHLGFDRVVVGTVTGDSYEGNPRPNIERYPETESLVNWLGLPGIGAEKVAQQLNIYGNYGVPLTINLMSTPGKEGDAILRDLEKTILALRDVYDVDRWELNISCPNTHTKNGEIDARKEYKKQLGDMIGMVSFCSHDDQDLYLKVSPDLTESDIESIISVSSKFIDGFTATNTTTHHNKKYIPKSPGKGGGSGDAVYEDALRVQRLFHEKIKGTNLKLIAVGGISSVERLKERMSLGAEEVQIFTPLIFSGPRLLREFRNYK
tara:strand:- start:961 stop:1992 length:1032 start_codon:yes stop_codon:yes gene_type:complete